MAKQQSTPAGLLLKVTIGLLLLIFVCAAVIDQVASTNPSWAAATQRAGAIAATKYYLTLKQLESQ